ncbi:SlyX family protein [Devosia sp.]|uniref:SlyX family protein n=1 Tax=Devosia sp. TaxID=1871048 RepID=UPI002EEFDE8B
MSESDDLKRRIERLEEVAAFQERTIEELSATLTDQWKQMQALKRELANLGAQLAEVEAAGATPQREPPPPHY